MIGLNNQSTPIQPTKNHFSKTHPPKTTIQKQGLIPYQLGYCKEMLLYAIVWKWNFTLSPFHFYFL